ncbi:MAG: Uncharacterised protein [Bacteroidia bacterium]|nr:MAG: Uncharacterised protein [Bacteroidia bacterium]
MPLKTFYFAFVFVAFNWFSVSGQNTVEINSNFLLFNDSEKDTPVLVINDSTMLHGYNFEQISAINFPEKDWEEFNKYQFNINDKTNLVHAGCGPVVTYSSGEFKRIDQSFRHKNQFGAVPVKIDNQIHLWGGYGMFTFKNILTKFDTLSGEWFEIEQSLSKRPQPQATNIYAQENNNLYVFGGFNKNQQNANIRNYLKDDVWKLNLNTLKWSRLAPFKLESFVDLHSSKKGFLINRNGKTIFIKSSITEFSIEDNVLVSYEINNFKDLLGVTYHPKSDQISYVFVRSNGHIEAKTQPYQEFRGEKIENTTFFESKINNLSYLGWAGAFLIIAIGLSYYIIKQRRKKRYLNTLIFFESKNCFHLNGAVLNDISESKKKILKHLIYSEEEFTPLGELNDLVSTNGFEKYTSIVKRRELFLNELRKELSLMLNMSKDDVFTTRKNAIDRRIKEITLNFNFIIKP